jgi:hypothetical protein
VYLAWGRYVAVANASMPPSASRRGAKGIHIHMQIGSAAKGVTGFAEMRRLVMEATR